MKAFVAGFIGISNLLPATVEDGGVRLGTGGLVPAPVPDELPAGSRGAALHPAREALDRRARGRHGVGRGRVAERVYLGTTTQLIVELGPGSRLVALEQNTSRARADDRWELGDRVRVGWRPEHAQVLR